MKLDKIQTQQNYHMVISALAPLLAEPVRKSLGKLFQGNKTPQDVNKFLKQVATTIKELPEELQVMVLDGTRGFGMPLFYFSPRENSFGSIMGKKALCR